MGNENNESPVLQKDRILAKILNTIPGLDAHKYNTEQLREIAASYGKACGVGAIAGATVGTTAAVATTLGLATPLTAPVGAAIGCVTGVGFRVYGLGIDTVSIAIDKFQQKLKRDNNSND